jgi:L-aspartate oxidase
MQSYETPVVVVGAGAAGLCAALHAAPRRVLVMAPDTANASCTELAKGGIAAPLAADDSVALHVADTTRAADHSGCRTMTQIIIGRALEAINFLEWAGVRFDVSPHGRDLHLEAGHCLPRILHADGDQTGAAIHRALLERARASNHIEFMMDASAVSLTSEGTRITGVVALRENGSPLKVCASETVLATGGLGQLFAATTNAPHASGDGLAMALAKGASVAGLEFVQFHPTALRCSLDPLPLITEALRGAGATLTADGRRFMVNVDARAELAPRDVVARAVWAEQQRGADVVLDARQVFNSAQGDGFPAALAACRAQGIEPARTPIPVTCAAHFHMGGIVVDEHGRTSLPGLWAAGEVAYTGLHGANRLASNSLLEAVVIGTAAGRAIARQPDRARPGRDVESLVPAQCGSRSPEWRRLRNLLWTAMGPVRDCIGLESALSQIRRLKSDLTPEEISMIQRLDLAEAMVASAIQREESRGAHWRSDFTKRNPVLDGVRACISPRFTGCAGAAAGARRGRRGAHRAGSGRTDG